MGKYWKKIAVAIIAALLLFAAGCVKGDDFGKWEDFEWTWTKPYDLQYDLNLPKVTVKVGIQNEAGNIETVAKFKKVFEKMYPNISIEFEKVAADWHNAMFNYVATQTLPDIIWLTGTDHMAYSSGGVFENLRPFYAASGMSLDDYYADIIKTTHYAPDDNGIWFAPQSYDKPVMYYNRKMFDVCGVPYPKNDWGKEDFLEACRALREGMDNNLSPSDGVQSSAYPADFDATWAAVYYGVMRSYGADVLTPQNDFTVDSVEMYNAMKFMRQLMENKYALKPASKGSSIPFYGKAAAMWTSSRPRLVSVVNSYIDVDFVPMPALTAAPRTAVGTIGYAMNSKSAVKAAAWQFMRFIITEQGQELYGSVGTGVPVLKTLSEDGLWTKYLADKNLNHKAFTMYPERDAFQNYTYGLPITKQAEAFNTVGDMVNNLSYDDYGIKTPSSDKLKTLLENTQDKLVIIKNKP